DGVAVGMQKLETQIGSNAALISQIAASAEGLANEVEAQLRGLAVGIEGALTSIHNSMKPIYESEFPGQEWAEPIEWGFEKIVAAAFVRIGDFAGNGK
ncbi:MAG: hypothetical protein AAFP86_22015, partial [Planctomycetota bacterium]